MEMEHRVMIRIMLEQGEAVNIYNGLSDLDLSELTIEERDAIDKFRNMLEDFV